MYFSKKCAKSGLEEGLWHLGMDILEEATNWYRISTKFVQWIMESVSTVCYYLLMNRGLAKPLKPKVE